jgi:hypothetical protein
MRVMLAVCRDCGYEKRIKIYDREDAERRNIRLVRPTCERCGSSKVELKN